MSSAPDNPQTAAPQPADDPQGKVPPVPEVHNEKLGIRDKDRSTEGGPPGWFAFSMVFLLYLPVAVIVIALLVWLGWG